MARIRTVKPELFTDDELWDLEAESRLPLRLAFIGLWTQCDREGRFAWRPRQLKAGILPYDTAVDFAEVLASLAKGRFVIPYEVDGQMFGYIRTFAKHQQINNREVESRLPAPTVETIAAAHKQLDLPLDASATREPPVADASATRASRDGDALRGEGKGREGKGREGVLHGTLTRHEPAPDEIVEKLPLNNGDEWPVTKTQVAESQRLFRAVDVEHELRMMRAWLLGNPTRRKTRTGVARFINTWLSREQDRSREKAATQKPRGTATDASGIIEQRRKAREQNVQP